MFAVIYLLSKAVDLRSIAHFDKQIIFGLSGANHFFFYWILSDQHMKKLETRFSRPGVSSKLPCKQWKLFTKKWHFEKTSLDSTHSHYFLALGLFTTTLFSVCVWCRNQHVLYTVQSYFGSGYTNIIHYIHALLWSSEIKHRTQ